MHPFRSTNLPPLPLMWMPLLQGVVDFYRVRKSDPEPSVSSEGRCVNKTPIDPHHLCRNERERELVGQSERYKRRQSGASWAVFLELHQRLGGGALGWDLRVGP
ncbi:hypothetical protein EYF80_030559 [Liparis tanakae]|uniref:Uncharacterized protein n=1 Tax=Liparis tanakae TaxID=230148 RepID=A0A4Z2H0A2_9TELE|nr:hypothetical protein EYF80_030559 [Liparis tanakae]